MTATQRKEIDLAFASDHELHKRVNAAITQNPDLSSLFGDVVTHFRKQDSQPTNTSFEAEDDEFGASFDDEADFLAATEAVENGKRPRDEDDGALSLSKRAKTNASRSVALSNRILKERFGLNGFRLKQEAAITRILDGGSAVIVFPTGGGKSLCYQVPAVAFRYQDEAIGSRNGQMSGITLVVSPLIALMKDQVDGLLRRGIKAAVLNSSLSRDKYLATQQDLRQGHLDLLYCAPERLNNEGFVASLKAIPGGIRLLAVDEAHCISEWGHSFRPDYLKIARFAKEASVERVACLTATATPKVARDICSAFSIPTEGLFTTTVYRPNLRLLAQSNPKQADNVSKLVGFLRQNPGPTIVYTTLQKGAEELAEELKSRNFSAKAFHAGMDTDVKMRTQDAFFASDNMIVVATIAFGMGIDKPNIRNIVHFDIPDSIESCSQQVGRAGRDGLSSVCLFNLSTKDFYLRNIFTYGDRPSRRSLKLLMEDICSKERKRLKVGETFAISEYHQSRDTDIKSTMLSIIYAQLELHYGFIRAAGSKYTEYKYKTDNPDAISRDRDRAAQAILRGSNKKKLWTYVPIEIIEKSSGLTREELVRKIDEWNERGMITVQATGVQQVYRLEKFLPATKQEIDLIVKQLDKTMETQEKQNLDRTKALINLITDKKCFSRALATYFGETSDRISEECGHCTWCETHQQVLLPNEPPQPPNTALVKRILDEVSARDDPRYLAKIAFGIKSPRMAQEGIYRKAVFESMNVCDFEDLLKSFTKECFM
ncbi:ATP-dependent DNA helicase [Bimuria novae-zelandiae CBS 107.79]|uniref:ATP-dependent DNA helicase n=1 Tax=Bimuria novae-zelandiae CBS 107.79 TaxID=1447943 RepID=A0A6A5VJ19_9PLEO|nr:ATP-dependent DNA helicase [Bimuria novae-zelandiae CBS 107.79]